MFVQNNLAELFMLMHFLDAAKFGSLEEFQDEYEDLGEAKQARRHHLLIVVVKRHPSES